MYRLCIHYIYKENKTYTSFTITPTFYLSLTMAAIVYYYRLLKLQKRAARIILQADFMTPSKEMFRELGWLTFSNRVEYRICFMVFKSLNGQAPEYLSSLLTKCSETNTRMLRSSEQEILKVPFARTSFYKRSFPVTGPKL